MCGEEEGAQPGKMLFTWFPALIQLPLRPDNTCGSIFFSTLDQVSMLSYPCRSHLLLLASLCQESHIPAIIQIPTAAVQCNHIYHSCQTPRTLGHVFASNSVIYGVYDQGSCIRNTSRRAPLLTRVSRTQYRCTFISCIGYTPQNV